MLWFICNFDVVYTNYYKDSDVLIVIGKKRVINKNKIKIDDPKKVLNFLIKWDKYFDEKKYF